MFYVYILKSKKDNKLYIGYSHNLRQRFKEHQSGSVFSTKNRRPFELVYYEAYKNEGDAKLRERGLKHSGSVYNGLVKRIKESIEN
jgi:putative endonuclease